MHAQHVVSSMTDTFDGVGICGPRIITPVINSIAIDRAGMVTGHAVDAFGGSGFNDGVVVSNSSRVVAENFMALRDAFEVTEEHHLDVVGFHRMKAARPAGRI